MKTKLLSLATLVFLSIGISAQETPTVKQEIKKDAKAVGTSVEKGAKWTGKTAKKGGKAVKEGYEDTKDFVKKETK
jgi:hypothetical protein